MKVEWNEAEPRRLAEDAGESSDSAFAALRRFTRTRPEVERCELCGADLSSEHPHLLDRRSRQIACACDACAILFCAQQSASFVRIPRRILQLENFAFNDLAWDAMMLPINLAFFVREPGGGVTALYPSPAGATSSLLDLPKWNELFGAEPVLASLEPEVEALLVNRIGTQRAYFVAPLDACYRLVGLIRKNWRGLSGGPEVWGSVAGFFAELERRATRIGAPSHA